MSTEDQTTDTENLTPLQVAMRNTADEPAQQEPEQTAIVQAEGQQANITDPEAVAAQLARSQTNVSGLLQSRNAKLIELDWAKRDQLFLTMQIRDYRDTHAREHEALHAEYQARRQQLSDRHAEQIAGLERQHAEKQIIADAIRTTISELEKAMS